MKRSGPGEATKAITMPSTASFNKEIISQNGQNVNGVNKKIKQFEMTWLLMSRKHYIYTVELQQEKKRSSATGPNYRNGTSNDSVKRPVRNVAKNSFNDDNISQKNRNVNTLEGKKLKQLEIIQQTNPMTDDYHTGIRSVDDIKTAEEVFTKPISSEKKK